METIVRLINIHKNADPYVLYKYLSSRFDKEDVNLAMYDQFGYECEKSLVQKRTEQDKYRKKLIDRYKVCVVTGNGDLVCEACHIKPFVLCDDKEKYDINNGILMDSSLHILFDKMLVSINSKTLEFEISNKLDRTNYDFVWKYHKKSLQINSKSKKYLEYHYALFEDLS